MTVPSNAQALLILSVAVSGYLYRAGQWREVPSELVTLCGLSRDKDLPSRHAAHNQAESNAVSCLQQHCGAYVLKLAGAMGGQRAIGPSSQAGSV